LEQKQVPDWAVDIAAARAGETRAYARIVRHFQDMAFAVALARLADPHAAEDAAQEAFIEAFVSLDSLKEARTFPAWLRTIVERQCSRMTRGKSMSSLPLAIEPSEDAPAPDQKLELRELKQAVLERVAQLPEHERTVMLMHYIADYSQREICEFLELPLTTIKKRLHDAKARLSRLLLTTAKDEIYALRPSSTDQLRGLVEFSTACIVGDEGQVRDRLERGPSLVSSFGEVDEPHMRRISAHWGWQPLHFAAHYGHLGIVKLLVQHGATLEAKALNSIGSTPLGAAVWGDRPEVVRYLVAQGAQLDVVNHFGQTPLHRAVRRGGVEVVRCLLQAGADHEFLDPEGLRPAEVAARSGNAEMVRVFEEHSVHEKGPIL
jgi:RNA polymerase sigma factor (sigma-70 family)